MFGSEDGSIKMIQRPFWEMKERNHSNAPLKLCSFKQHDCQRCDNYLLSPFLLLLLSALAYKLSYFNFFPVLPVLLEHFIFNSKLIWNIAMVRFIHCNVNCDFPNSRYHLYVSRCPKQLVFLNNGGNCMVLILTFQQWLKAHF